MRLIDATALINRITKKHGLTEIILDVDDSPTIDAVEVVRCKDCKYYKPSAVASRKMCFRKDVDGTQVCYDFQPGDFCSYVERRSE